MRYYRERPATTDLNKWHRLAESVIRSVIQPGQLVAEFGCGSGEFLRQLATSYKIEVVGFDISQVNIARLRQQGLRGEVIDFAEAPLPIRDEEFDFVLSCEVIEHLVNPGSFVRELYRSLKPGGYLCLTTPNAFNLLRRLSFFLGHHRDPLMDPTRSEFAEHLRAFSFDMVTRLLRMQGFRVVKSIGDRVPGAQVYGLGIFRSLLSSEMCFLARKK